MKNIWRNINLYCFYKMFVHANKYQHRSLRPKQNSRWSEKNVKKSVSALFTNLIQSHFK